MGKRQRAVSVSSSHGPPECSKRRRAQEEPVFAFDKMSSDIAPLGLPPAEAIVPKHSKKNPKGKKKAKNQSNVPSIEEAAMPVQEEDKEIRTAATREIEKLKAETERLKKEMESKNAVVLAQTTLLQNLQASFNCPVCLEVLSRPHALGCGHTFCASCLSQWFHRAATSDDDRRPRRGNRKRNLICPSCRAECHHRPPLKVPILIDVATILHEHRGNPSLGGDIADVGETAKEKPETEVDSTWGGLWTGMEVEKILDSVDGVFRCTGCNWEVSRRARSCHNCARNFWVNDELDWSENEETDDEDDAQSLSDEDPFIELYAEELEDHDLRLRRHRRCNNPYCVYCITPPVINHSLDRRCDHPDCPFCRADDQPANASTLPADIEDRSGTPQYVIHSEDEDDEEEEGDDDDYPFDRLQGQSDGEDLEDFEDEYGNWIHDDSSESEGDCWSPSEGSEVNQVTEWNRQDDLEDEDHYIDGIASYGGRARHYVHRLSDDEDGNETEDEETFREIDNRPYRPRRLVVVEDDSD